MARLERRLIIARRVAGLLAALMSALSLSVAFAQDGKQIAAGERIYSSYCSTCHGDNLVSSGQTFDLRRLRADERPRFEGSVINGKGQMPPWKGTFNNEEIEQLWHFIRANANDK